MAILWLVGVGSFVFVSHHTITAGPKQSAKPIGIANTLQNLSITSFSVMVGVTLVKRVYLGHTSLNWARSNQPAFRLVRTNT